MGDPKAGKKAKDIDDACNLPWSRLPGKSLSPDRPPKFQAIP